MIKDYNLQTLWRGMQLLLLLVFGGVLSSGKALAQDDPKGPPEFKYVLSSPTVKDVSFTNTGLSVQFDNVYWKWENSLSFYEILTWEYDIKNDGPFNIAEASFLPQTGDIALESQVYLDEYMSQTGWSVLNGKITPSGLLLDPTIFLFPPEVEIPDYSAYCQLGSPMMFLRGQDKTFTVTFSASAPTDNSEDAVLLVYTYGQELPKDSPYDPQLEIQEVTVPKDGETHEYTLTFKNGTWNHRVMMGPKNKAKVNIVGTITVTQNLKKGDHVYRSVYYNHYDKSGLFPENAENKPSTLYTHYNDKIKASILDVKTANKAGAYLAYRTLYRYLFEGSLGNAMWYSMYSDPYYLPGQDVPDNSSKYLYLGYVEKEAPMTENVAPGSSSDRQTYIGAIKIPQKMSESLRKQGAKVVGVRFCAGAKAQHGQWFEIPGFEPNLPFAFVAENMKKQFGDDPDAKNEFLQKKVQPIAEGWNDVFFDKPYPITEKDFYVGYCVYDASGNAQVMYVSDKVFDKGPDSRLTGYTVNTSDYDRIGLADNYSWQALLIQAIVSLEQDVIDVSADSIYGEPFYYDNAPLSFDVQFRNNGNVDVNKLKVEVGVKGELESQEITFDTPISSGNNIVQKITLANFPKQYGNVEITARILEINGEAVADMPAVSFFAMLLDAKKTFSRNALVELYTDENCVNCPIAERDFFEFFGKLSPDMQSKSIFVFHHEGLRGDPFTMEYSRKMMPFFGVKLVDKHAVLDKATPKVMTNRSVNPNLTRNSTGILGTLPPSTRFASVFEYAIKKDPAFASLNVKAKFEEDSTIRVVVKGNSSDLLDRSKNVSLTLLMTQNNLPEVNQKGITHIPDFVHNHVLRYVDDKGFMGTPVTFDEKGDFELVYNISPELVEYDGKEDLAIKKVKDNQFIMLDGKGNSLSKIETLSNVDVIAILHYAKDLPKEFDLTAKNEEIFHNAVINAAQAKITNLDLGTGSIVGEDLYFFIEAGKLHHSGVCRSFSVYSVDGVRLDPQGFFEPGVYVVKATLNNGETVIKKVVCKNQ